MPTLHLTSEEEAALRAAFPQELLASRTIVAETLTFEDSDEAAADRLGALELSTPELVSLVDALRSADSAEKAVSLLDAMRTTEVTNRDIIEILFALGPTQLSALLLASIQAGGSTDALNDVVTLAYARHALLQSMQPNA